MVLLSKDDAKAPPALLEPMKPVAIKGYKFFDSDGKELVIRGIDYYPRPNAGPLDFNSLDFYSEEHRHIWQRDIEFFRELGVNAIRLYAVDPKLNHDAFMCALQEAGIYVIVALAHDCPWCAITRDQAPDCYPHELKLQGKHVIDAFAKYPNTLAFSAGNEVNHVAPPGNPGWNAPCQRKFIQDMREYVHGCSQGKTHMRKIPIGLVAADSDRIPNSLYYNCQEDPEDEFGNAEWFGLNDYLHCYGKGDEYQYATGLRNLAKDYRGFNYSIPVVLTEFGCLSDTFPDVGEYESQRTWHQAKWMIEEPEMRNLYSGGFAFEYSIEKSNAQGASPYPFKKFGQQKYGIGYFSPEHCDEIDIPCEYNPMPEFDFLKEAYTTAVEPLMLTKDDFEPEPFRTGRSKCPEGMKLPKDFDWEADRTRIGRCPRLHQFTCPGFLPATSTESEGTSSGKVGAIESSFVFPWIALFICLLVVVCAAIIFVFRKTYKIKRKPAPSLSKSNGSDGSLSDESAGLLSMKNMGNGNTPYHSIDSESSGEDSDTN